MVFLDFADHCITQGTARRISQDEALSILQANQKDGLVLMPSNSKKAQFVCSCCPDCCGPLSGLRMAERPADRASSSYRAAVDQDLCAACGDCAELCPMGAIDATDEFARIDEIRCIGCGVCVARCSTSAMQLRVKESSATPPDSLDDLYEEYERIADT